MTPNSLSADTLANLPSDPFLLLSYINTKLRDQYPGGLDELCDDLDIDRGQLVERLGKAGFDYLPSVNQFR